MSTPGTETRDLVYRHLRQTAVNDVFSDTLASVAAAVGCSRDAAGRAVKSLIRDGVLTVATRGTGRLSSEYRIMGPRRVVTIPATTEPPLRRPRNCVAMVFDYAARIAVDGAFEVRIPEVAAACRINARETKEALGVLLRDAALQRVYRGNTGRPSRYQIIGVPREAEPAVPATPRAPRQVSRPVESRPVVRVVDRPVDRVRLVAPGTYPASGYSMLRAR